MAQTECQRLCGDGPCYHVKGCAIGKDWKSDEPHVHSEACTRTFPDCDGEPPTTAELLRGGAETDNA